MEESGFKFLESNLNKTALHTNCHKLKTKIDQEYLLKPWRKIKKKVSKLTLNPQILSTKLYLEDERLLSTYLSKLELLYNIKDIKRIHVVLSKMKKITKDKS